MNNCSSYKKRKSSIRLNYSYQNFRYGGIKQSKSCYEREGTKKMCTTINCEFQNVGKECNETTTAIEVT